METGWYPVQIPCGKCGEQMSLVAAAYSADGELRYQFGCLKCASVMQWRIFSQQLQALALVQDIERRFEGVKPPKTIQPPLQITPPKITEEDRKFERSCGIEPEEAA